MKPAIRDALRRLTYLLGYQNLDHLTLVVQSRLRKVDEFFILELGASAGDFVRHPKARLLTIAPHELTHVDLLCVGDAATLLTWDFASVRPVIVWSAGGPPAAPPAAGRRSSLPDVIALLRREGYDVMLQADALIAHRRGRLAV